MKGVITQYIGATNKREARIKAFTDKQKLIISYPDELNCDKAHRLAAELLCKQQGWDVRLHQGSHPNGKGYLFVMEEKVTSDMSQDIFKMFPEGVAFSKKMSDEIK